MPVRDDDLERAVRAAAPRVDGAGAFDQVMAKRAHRRTMRATRLGLLAMVGVVAIVGSVVLVARDDDPARITTPAATVPGTTAVSLIPDQGYLRGPLTISGDAVSVASCPRDGTGFDFPPSSIVRFDPGTLRFIDRVELKAEIHSVAEGADGVRWAVTRNKDPDGPVIAGTFLKRIAPDGDVLSVPLPAGTELTGPVIAGPSGVIVPVRRGSTVAMQFDASGRFVADLATMPAETTPCCMPRLPAGFVVESIQVHGARTLVQGKQDGVPAAVLVRDNAVVKTITLAGDGVGFAWVDDDTVLATSDGQLLRIDVTR